MGTKASKILLETLEPRTLLSGLTLITHGYEPISSDRPPWLDDMKDAIIASTGADTAVYALRINSDDTGTPFVESFDWLEGDSPADPFNPNADVIIMLDWAAASGVVFKYTDTASIAALVEPYLLNIDQSRGIFSPLAEMPLHLIGHSRGGSLVCALASQLEADGIWVDQLTTLDPHPVDQDADALIPANIFFADNYFETDNPNLDEAFVTGLSVPGAHNIDLTDIVLGHGAIHTYYHGTIDPAADSAAENEILPDWYQYFDTGPRADVGYAWSRAIGRERPLDGVHFPSTDTLDGWDNIMILDQNDDLSLLRGGTINIETIFDDNNADAHIEVGFDDDDNPYNGLIADSGHTTSTAALSTQHWTATLDTTSVPNGTYRIYSAISNGSTTRYYYAPASITIAPGATISINDASASEGNTDTANARFTISLSQPSDQTITVDYAFADSSIDSATTGIDYAAGTGAITFAPGQRTQFLDVPIFSDTLIEPDEHFFVVLSNPTNAQIADDTGQGIILNDDLDLASPTAKLKSSKLPASGKASRFSLIFSDNLSLNASSIGPKDILVTGPHRYRQLAKFISKSPTANSPLITATYQISAPGGRWNSADNGIYTVWLEPSAIRDTSGNAMPQQKLGAYRVRLTTRTKRIRRSSAQNLADASPPQANSIFQIGKPRRDDWRPDRPTLFAEAFYRHRS